MLDNHPWIKWAALIIVGGVLEHQALKTPQSRSTLSAVTRWVFRTETSKSGRIVFLLSWGALTAWFVPHILRKPKVFP